MFITDNGQVFSCGSNVDLQLGVGDGFAKTKTPVHVSIFENTKIAKVEASHSSACITAEGELYLWGRGIWGESPFPIKLLTISNRVVDVSLGRDMNFAVDEEGLSWGWGENTHGELGVGDNEPRVHPYPILNLKG